MERDERVFTVQFSKSLSQLVGKPTYSFIAEGFEREFQVVPQSELIRVQGLLEDAKDLLERMWDYVPGGDEDTCNRYDSFVEKLK